MTTFFHAVTLDKDKCMGCTNCIKRCPTQAIRVQNGKAKILSELCIDCGECIRVCPHHAKQAICDGLDVLNKFEYKIALPAPSLYAQFNNLDEIDTVINGLLKIGFDDVFEVSKAAELVSDATRKLIEQDNLKMPVISSACPTIARLIRIRYPNLINNLLPLITPAELAGKLAKEKAVRETGLSPEKIGTVFISPCPAKVRAMKTPLGIEKSYIDAVVAIKDVYPILVNTMKKTNESYDLSETGRLGISWGSSGGEASAVFSGYYLAADGIENCLRVLNDLEDDKISHVGFVELNACPGGCVGGVLTVENPYLAMVKLKMLRHFLPVSKNHIESPTIPPDYKWNKPVDFLPVMQLDPDMNKAFKMMNEIDRLTAKFRGLDCGSCGSPSCRSLAEDIVKGYSTEEACVFVLKDEMQNIADSLSRLSGLQKNKE